MTNFYHGTSRQYWGIIQEEGVLWGRQDLKLSKDSEFHPDRCTYLTPDLKEASEYGEVVLEVDWEPKSEGVNNYVDGCWQFREYRPIPLSRVKVVGWRDNQ